MNKRKSLGKDPVLSRIRDEVIEYEDQLRDSYLANRNVDDARLYGLHDVTKSLIEFMHLRKKTNAMQERFELALRPEYQATVSTVELGVTDDAECHDSLDTLKDNYLQLLYWAIENGYTTGEMAREDSLRDFSVRLAPSDNTHVIVTRTRPLFVGNLSTHDDRTTSSFAVYKRMVFGMPGALYTVLCEDDPTIEKDDTKQRFEQQIDNNHHHLYPIRTGYYFARTPTA